MDFDFSKTLDKIQESYGKNERRAKQFGLGNSLEAVSDNPNDYVVMPEWWRENYGVLGIRFGHFVEIAGDPDSGKTSLALIAMLQAQAQGYVVVYVETEGKTSELDLINAGLDPKGIITIHTKITEEVYEGVNRALDAVFDDFPEAKVFLVLDSYGNTTSMRDSEIDLTAKKQQPGGAAKVNRMGLGAIAAKQINHEIAVLVVNYNYDNIGGVGKTNAGGKALGFYAMLRLQSTRKAWYTKTQNGVRVRAGADVQWVVYKNHYAKALKTKENKTLLLPDRAVFRISAEGFKQLKVAA